MSGAVWVLGFSSGPHDSGAALLRDGAVVAAANEERFTRRKMDGRFPEQSIQFCLGAAAIDASVLDVVAHGWNMLADAKMLDVLTRRLLEEPPEVAHGMQAFMTDTMVTDQNIMRRVEEGLAKLGIPQWKLRCYDHHLCHAAAALLHGPSCTDDICITLDGRGDYMSGRIVDSELSVLACTTMFDSIGFLWAFVTAVLGFKPFRHEGKLTGLAASGEASKTLGIFKAVLGLQQCGTGTACWELRVRWATEGGRFILYFAELEKNPAQARSRLEEFALCKELRQHSREDVAAGLQAFTEQIVVEYLRCNGFLRKRLRLSGGVFSNVLLNMRLREQPEVESVYVYPNMGDGGLCMGAALLASRERGCLANQPPTSAECPSVTELGPAFPVAASELPESSVEFHDELSFARSLAEALHAGSVVGLFWGRMEFGPRALGRRSLLCVATDSSTNASLNARLRRTEFMPFAPVTLRERAAKAYHGWSHDDEASRYMTICYQTTQSFKEQCPAVVHLDGTARPQIVDERDGVYFLILQEYCRLSGIPTLINTSFNIHEEPIVCSVADAVRSFQKGACDVLAVYPYIVR